MELNRGVIGVLAAACVAAGAGGAYLATRTSDPAATASIAATTPASDTSTPGVEQSEGVISDDATATPAIPPAATPATTRKAPVSAEPRTAARPPATPERPATPAVASTTRTTAPRTEQTTPVAENRPVDTRPCRSGTDDRSCDTGSTCARAHRATRVSSPGRAACPTVRRTRRLGRFSDRSRGRNVALERTRARRRRSCRARDARRQGRRPRGDSGRLEGARQVTLVERGGRVKDRARLGIRFTSVVAGRRHARADSRPRRFTAKATRRAARARPRSAAARSAARSSAASSAAPRARPSAARSAPAPARRR